LVLMRWRLFYREPSTLFWSYGFPLILTIALGIAFRNRPPDPVVLAVATDDGSADQEAIRTALGTLPLVKLRFLTQADAERQLHTGKVDLLLFPRHGDSQRRYLFDPTRPESRTARLLIDDLLQRAAGRADPIVVADSHVTVPGARYIDFLVPGLLGFGLMSSGLWGVGFVIAEMRSKRLLKRLAATPMSRSKFLLSFILTRGFFLLGELPLLLGFAYLLFGVPIRGSLVSLCAVALLGAFVFAGMGMLCATRAPNVQTVGGLINLISMPMMIGSGVFFSPSRFPDVLQPALKVLPLTALNDMLRGIMLDGAGLSDLAMPLVILSAWGAVAFALALWLFRWR